MITWTEFERQQSAWRRGPKAVLPVRHRPGLPGHHPARRRPRVHPVCPVISPAGLHLLISAGPKQQDLRRDGRYALHSDMPAAHDDGFAITGRAREVTDAETLGVVAAGPGRTGREGLARLRRGGHFRTRPRKMPADADPGRRPFPGGTHDLEGRSHGDAGKRGAARYRYLAVAQGSPGLGSEGRVSDTMSHATADRYAWTEPGVEDLGGGVHRIPLPLPIGGAQGGQRLRHRRPRRGRPHRRRDCPASGPRAAHRGMRQIGYELGDIRNFLVTHIHIDHYSLAVELRKTFSNVISLGEDERANLIATREMVSGNGNRFSASTACAGSVRWSWSPGAFRAEPVAARPPRPGRTRTAGGGRDRPRPADAHPAGGAHARSHPRPPRLPRRRGAAHVRGRPRAAAHHPLDRVEAAGNRMALSDYLGSLAGTLALPDARLLPAHGPVTGSTHERIHELLAHHDTRLAETLSAVGRLPTPPRSRWRRRSSGPGSTGSSPTWTCSARSRRSTKTGRAPGGARRPRRADPPGSRLRET